MTFALLSSKDINSNIEFYEIEDDLYIGYDYYGRPLSFHIDEDNGVYSTLSSLENKSSELLSLIHKKLDHEDLCTYDTIDDESVKAHAAAYFSSPISPPSMWEYIKNLFMKKSIHK